MVFDGAHASVLRYDQLRHAVVVSSFARLTMRPAEGGLLYCASCAHHRLRKVHQFVTFTTHTPTQWAINDFMRAHPEHETELPTARAKADAFFEAFGHCPHMTPSRGTYFQLADYSQCALLAELMTLHAQSAHQRIRCGGYSYLGILYAPPEDQRLSVCANQNLCCERPQAGSRRLDSQYWRVGER